MKKKYSLYITLLLTTGMLVSCSKWLEINPKQDVYEETMFEKIQGYYAALNGLYVRLSEQRLYGENLSWGAMEAWGQGYTLDVTMNKKFYQLANLNYEVKEVKETASQMWLACYNTIAEANNLIQNLESDQQTDFPLGDVVKNMLLGEAYAVRALMHFEVVRIFAQAPVLDNGGVTAYVPYVEKFPSKVNVPLPTKDILANIIADLEKAKILIKPFDTDAQYPGYMSYNEKEVGSRLKLDNGLNYKQVDDEFFRYRANRLSYYPVLQLLARVSLYAGDKDKAFENANEIVNLVEIQKLYSFVNANYIGDPATLDAIEPRLHSEILFGTYNQNMEKWTQTYFDATQLANTQLLQVSEKNIIFAANPSDCRLNAIPQSVSTKYVLKGRNETRMIAAKSLVPVLRLPESYYIAAESIFDKDQAKAVEIFNKAVTYRKNTAYKITGNISKEDFQEAIVKEYRREFLTEGAMIFLYKRLNLPFRQNGTTVDHHGKLVMSVPDSEAGIQ